MKKIVTISPFGFISDRMMKRIYAKAIRALRISIQIFAIEVCFIRLIFRKGDR